MFYVQSTITGTRHYGAFSSNPDAKDAWPGDEATAKSLCNASNKRAEKLGISTRYEVVED